MKVDFNGELDVTALNSQNGLHRVYHSQLVLLVYSSVAFPEAGWQMQESSLILLQLEMSFS